MDCDTVLLALDKLLVGYRSNERAPYFDCFAEDASVVLYSSPVVYYSKSDFEQEWLNLRAEYGFKVIQCDSRNPHVSQVGDTAVVIHEVTTSYSYCGEVITSSDRETVVFKRDHGGPWLVWHEHMSPLSSPG